MRRILVNHARDRGRQKRGGSDSPVSWSTNEIPDQPLAHDDLPELDEALSRLEEIDRRKAEVVQLRYFGGLTIEETADALGISPAQIKRDWSIAKAWLYRDLRGESPAR